MFIDIMVWECILVEVEDVIFILEILFLIVVNLYGLKRLKWDLCNFWNNLDIGLVWDIVDVVYGILILFNYIEFMEDLLCNFMVVFMMIDVLLFFGEL